jgi:hypothetical protein
VQLANYKQFLDIFEEVTGVDKTIRRDLETMTFTGMLSHKVKTFTCEAEETDVDGSCTPAPAQRDTGSRTNGKYGMYMAVKHPDEEKIDVAYAMFNFDGVFVTANPFLERLKHTRVDDLVNLELGNYKPTFRKGDIDDLASNFITTKALQAFAQSGYIRKVTFIEESSVKAKA